MDTMKQILISQGQVAIVDDENYAAVIAAGPWYAQRNGNTFYARSTRRFDGVKLAMHSFVFGALNPDHINRNGLDNRQQNLRAATSSQNQRNRGKVHAYAGHQTTSQYKGVRWRSNQKTWEASLRVNGKYIYLGNFLNERDAALAYNIAAYLAYGNFAIYNILK